MFILDIVIVALIAYYAILFLRRTHSTWVFRGSIVLAVVALVILRLDLPLAHILLRGFLSVFLIVLVVVFQRELRTFFEDAGIAVTSFLKRNQGVPTEHPASILAETVRELAERSVGALIVLPGKEPIERFLEGGYRILAEVSPELILSIFDTNTPGHDGAMVIDRNEIHRFATQLPLAHKPPSLGRRQLGTRHSAGLGLSERTDALVVIVSEERGAITLAEKGALRCVETEEDLERTLADFFVRTEDIQKKDVIRAYLSTNLMEKGLAIAFALLAWYFLVYR